MLEIKKEQLLKMSNKNKIIILKFISLGLIKYID